MRIEAAQKMRPVVGVKVSRPMFNKAWSFKHCFQMVGTHAWAAENKYDGEYCEIHVDLSIAPHDVKNLFKEWQGCNLRPAGATRNHSRGSTHWTF